MEMQHIHECDLVIGQPIPWNVYDRNGHLLLHAGVVIQTPHQVDELKERGLFVDKADWEDQKGIVQKEKISPFTLLDDLNGQMERMLGRITADDSLLERTQNIAKTVQQICDIDTEVAIAGIFVGEEARYPVRHPIHVAILAEIMAKRFNRPPEERLILISAAITMNISMVNLQAKLQANQAAITAEQQQEIHDHPLKSHEILKEKGVTEALWLNAVLQHHERTNGSGYPNALQGDQISPMARVLAIADIYCARIFDRADRPSVPASVALRDLFQERGKLVDAMIIEQFFKELGMYPPGSFVRLANGDLAIVTKRGKSAVTPVVYSVAGPWGAPLSVYIKRDCTQEKYTIREAVRNEDAVIKVNRHMLWGFK